MWTAVQTRADACRRCSVHQGPTASHSRFSDNPLFRFLSNFFADRSHYSTEECKRAAELPSLSHPHHAKAPFPTIAAAPVTPIVTQPWLRLAASKRRTRSMHAADITHSWGKPTGSVNG